MGGFDPVVAEVKATLLDELVDTTPPGIDDPVAIVNRYEEILEECMTESEKLGATPVAAG